MIEKTRAVSILFDYRNKARNAKTFARLVMDGLHDANPIMGALRLASTTSVELVCNKSSIRQSVHKCI